MWAWFKKGSGTVVRSTLRAVPATVPDPFLNHALLMVLKLSLGCVAVSLCSADLSADDADNTDMTVIKNVTASEIVSTGRAELKLRSFDRLMTSFIAQHQLPGAALAVTHNGRLVYARGFGYANVEAKQQVQPDNLFRIASISKPITAVAILQLVEAGRLKLDDKVVEILDVKPHRSDNVPSDARLRKVAVLELLQHTGGWDRDVSFDPMFRPVDIAKELGVQPPADPAHVIRYMFGKPLDFDPGARYAYSNFGYCLLGRIIEKLSKQPYDQFVRRHVLEPVGIRTMQLGKTWTDKRAPNEVKYYAPAGKTGESVFAKNLGQQVPLPYGAWHLEAMDSHGGWVASAVDLLRFATAFDQPSRSVLLKLRSIETMFERPAGLAGFDEAGRPKAAYYGCGWLVRPVGSEGKFNCWHTGSLDGTSTLLVRRHDGVNWAVLFNTRTGKDVRHPARAIDSLVHRAANAVKVWPEFDLFESFE